MIKYFKRFIFKIKKRGLYYLFYKKPEIYKLLRGGNQLYIFYRYLNDMGEPDPYIIFKMERYGRYCKRLLKLYEKYK